MSTSSFLYTEAYIDNKWVCINPTFKKEGKRRLAMTYESGSRSYFGQTADKIGEIGGRLRFVDLSAEVQGRYESCRNDEFVRILSADVDVMRNCLPSGQAHEYHGIVLKDSVFAYESGDPMNPAILRIYMNRSPRKNMQNWMKWANSSISTTSGTIPWAGSCILKKYWSTCSGRSTIGIAFTAMRQSINAEWLRLCSE